jgi:serine/threonine-protein kinase
MAPEQVEGKPADARTDIWALGAILYEMITRHRAFEASTPPSLIAVILEREPTPLAERQPLTPPSLERLVHRCLAKDPDDRWDTAHDVAVRLREIAEADQEVEARLRARGTPRWVIPALAAVAVAALLVGALAAWWWRGSLASAPQAPVMRAEIDLTPDLPLRGHHPVRTELAISRDGRHLAWASQPGDDSAESALYLRQLDTGEVTRLAGTEGAQQPFFSPDGRWLGFWAREGSSGEGTLRKVPVEGGLVVDLAPLWRGRQLGATWEPDGRIFLGSGGTGIQWVPAEGGSPQEITVADRAREAGHRLPSLLPGGGVLLFTAMPSYWGVNARIEALSLRTGERKVLVEDGADARYLVTGHLVFVRRGVLMAAPFDQERLELTAPPVPVIEGVSQALNMGNAIANSGAGQFAVSDSGLLVYAPGGLFEDPPQDLLLLNEAGRAEPLPGFDKPLLSSQVNFSPDGRQLVFVERAISGLLWLFDVERQTFRALSNRGMAASPRWSPDGTHLAVTWSEGGPFHLWRLPLDGGEWEQLTDGPHYDFAPSWSPDGRFLAFCRGMDIFLYRFEDQKVVPFVDSPAAESHPEFSPDGRWLAYTSEESGRDEVYVTSFPDRKQTLTVSRQGGLGPAWSQDGKRLFYHSLLAPDGNRSMMAVTVRHGAKLSLGPPTTLFRYPFLPQSPMRGYDLHPDGRRFLVAIEGEHTPPPPITRLQLVHNWFTELERLAPTR